MALTTFALLSVLVIVEGSITQWNTGCNDSSNCSDTWFFTEQFDNGSTACECGSGVGKVISCDEASGQVELLGSYCMTYDSDNISLVVGKCYFGLNVSIHNEKSYLLYHRYPLPCDPSLLNQRCDGYGRTGQLCGKCKDGFTLPVYSYSLSCVECTDYSYNWMKYVAATFLPLTIFFLVVIIFRVSVTAGLLDVFILFSQLITFPALMRPLSIHHIKQQRALPVFSGLSMYGIWNLDFFRLLYPPFCMHPKMTTLHVLFLDYAIAVYPLLLIVTSYILVELHDNNFRLIVWLWKPFHRCFVSFRKEWNIKNSLIDAFCTFLLLSYFKFLSVSFDLLVPVSIFNIHGETNGKYYLLFDGSVEYFGPEHLPFGILALIVLLVFNILPLVLLCLYPCQCFQRCLNYCRIRGETLHIFMDSFQGCYKNRTSNACDYRWFSALYLIIRIALMTVYGLIQSNNFVIPLAVCLCLVLLFLLAVFHPYKSPIHNSINIFLLFIVCLYLVSDTDVIIAYRTSALLAHSRIKKLADVITGILFVIPLLFFIALLLYKCFGHRSCTKRVCRRICALMPCGGCSAVAHSGSEESLADRIINAEQYPPLLSEPFH